MPKPSITRLFAIFFITLFLISFKINISTATEIDIMFVYDNGATTWVNNNGGMSAFSQDVINRMNQAMQNSGIDATFRLVHSMTVNTTETSLSIALSSLRAGSGAYSAVHTARNTYGADLVAMFIDTGSAYGVVGVGYLLTTWSGSPNYAFTANAIRSVAISHTLTHEVGHNLGADHSKYQSSSPGPNNYLTNPIAPYSAGWYFIGTGGVKYHTIMAYNYDGYGNYYTSAPIFSSPLITYQGGTAGHAEDGDNARLIRITKDIIANYKQGSPGCTYSINPTTASFQASGGSSQVSVTASSSSCTWTATSNASWITITSGSSGTGNGTVSYSVSANTSTSTRTGTITIAGQTHTVTQAGVSQHTLTVTKSGTGSGTVTAGSNCTLNWVGSTGTCTVNSGTAITLSASAVAGSTFAGWSAGTGSASTCSGTGNCTFNITQNSGVTATFNLIQYTLTVTKSGTGTGTVTSSPAGIDCGSDCSEAYNSGTSVTLTATPAAGSTFAGWSGGTGSATGCTGTGNCTFNITQNSGVTAIFTHQGIYTGDFNGDGMTDILTRNPSTGGAVVRQSILSGGNWNGWSNVWAAWPVSHSEVYVGDFNGDVGKISLPETHQMAMQ